MTNLFFEFNSKTSHYWKDIRLYSTVYTIAIPKATSIYLTLLRFNDNQPISLQNPDPMYRSVVATPNYGTSKLNEYFIPQFIRYSIGNYPVKFTALNYNIQKPDIFFITSNTTTY
uniref:Uncharacterized protein n=1 Tax=Panagrolaimus sp. PS1159 TaxID=55785 RepID=A0AC35FHL2_9BILA